MAGTAELGLFVSHLGQEELPLEVTEKARTCLLNSYGIGLASHDLRETRLANKAVLALDGTQPAGASLLSCGVRVPISGAAFGNATLFHGRGQDDTCGAAHLGAVLVPMLTALAESRRYPLDRMIPALVAGYETGGLLEQAFAPESTPAGFRSTPLFGTPAAAAAASRMMGLGAEKTAAAIGNAVSLTGGLLQAFSDGTDEWRYHVGWAARNGLIAAELASQGSLTAPNALEGPAGFARAFASKAYDATELSGRLGKTWSIERVTFKPYPVCAFNQTPVIAALEMRERAAGREILSVKVRLNPYEAGYAGVSSKGPFRTFPGTVMSAPFCISIALLRGAPTLAAMTSYDDGAVCRLVDCVDVIADETVSRLCCRLEVLFGDGSVEVNDKRLTTQDFNFGWKEVSAMVRRIGQEEGVAEGAYDRIEQFCRALPHADIRLVVDAFALSADQFLKSAELNTVGNVS